MDIYIYMYMCAMYIIFHVLSCNSLEGIKRQPQYSLIYRLMASISFNNPQMQIYVHSRRKSTHAEMSYMCLQQHMSHLTTNTCMCTRTHARTHTRAHTHTHTPFDHSVWCTVYTIAYRYIYSRQRESQKGIHIQHEHIDTTGRTYSVSCGTMLMTFQQ